MTPQDTPPPLDLEAIKARAAAATPGPWTLEHDDMWVASPTVDHDWLWLTGEIKFPDDGYTAESTDEENRGKKEIVQANCRFIAASRQDIPALIAEIERLRGVDQGNGVREAFQSGFDAGYSNADDSYPGPDVDEAWKKFQAKPAEGGTPPIPQAEARENQG